MEHELAFALLELSCPCPIWPSDELPSTWLDFPSSPCRVPLDHQQLLCLLARPSRSTHPLILMELVRGHFHPLVEPFLALLRRVQSSPHCSQPNDIHCCHLNLLFLVQAPHRETFLRRFVFEVQSSVTFQPQQESNLPLQCQWCPC